MKRLLLAAISACTLLASSPAWADDPFRVAPYVQNPSPQAMSVLWVAHRPGTARVSCWDGEKLVWQGRARFEQPAAALAYSPWEGRTFGPRHPGYQGEVRIEGLQPGHAYRYQVEVEGQACDGQFRTAPPAHQPIRFIAYSDCETEPESTDAKVDWDDPRQPGHRRYLVDQTVGYAANLQVIRERRPDFVVIPGDIVESGGEQRDWDEFWKHNRTLASSIPIFGVLGNHEYYGGPHDGGYEEESSERAVAKFRSYFRSPSNQPEDARERGRYYRVDYGPISLIAIDGCNGQPHQSSADTNHFLSSHGRPHGDFNPNSPQYRWLEAQLRETQSLSKFTFVAFHHCPYSSGVHGAPPGSGPDQDTQSGQPLRILTPLFLRYGVDVLLTGHDEMLERSEVLGTERLPGLNGQTRTKTLQVIDVGIGGDGLRGPSLSNPWRKFLAHSDSPEIWRDGVLVDGGKHYGHLEVEVAPTAGGGWQATLTPVYIFPVMDSNHRVLRFERRIYKDVVILKWPGSAP